MATLTVRNTTNYSNSFLAFVNVIDFVNGTGTSAIATFGSWQFKSGGISPFVLIDGSSGTNAIVVNLNTLPFDASGWSFFNWSLSDSIRINGSVYSDFIIGSARDDTICGGRGGDTINGFDGWDTIIGGPGGDILVGGDGYDTVSYRGSAAVTVNLLTGLVSGGDANGDVISGFEAVTGGSEGDRLTGDLFDNVLNGAAGNDTLSGREGFDLLIGGAGADRLTGGLDADVFQYEKISDSGTTSTTRDVITDFQGRLTAGTLFGDKIDLSMIDAQASTAGIQALEFIGTAGSFTGEGQIRAVQSGTSTLIEINVLGSGGADMSILLSNFTATNLTEGDFIL